MTRYLKDIFRNLFSKTDAADIESLRRASEDGAFNRAYQRRKAEIDSLRQYDRGEKTIVAPDLGRFVQ